MCATEVGPSRVRSVGGGARSPSGWRERGDGGGSEGRGLPGQGGTSRVPRPRPVGRLVRGGRHGSRRRGGGLDGRPRQGADGNTLRSHASLAELAPHNGLDQARLSTPFRRGRVEGRPPKGSPLTRPVSLGAHRLGPYQESEPKGAVDGLQQAQRRVASTGALRTPAGIRGHRAAGLAPARHRRRTGLRGALLPQHRLRRAGRPAHRPTARGEPGVDRRDRRGGGRRHPDRVRHRVVAAGQLRAGHRRRHRADRGRRRRSGAAVARRRGESRLRAERGRQLQPRQPDHRRALLRRRPRPGGPAHGRVDPRAPVLRRRRLRQALPRPRRRRRRLPPRPARLPGRAGGDRRPGAAPVPGRRRGRRTRGHERPSAGTRLRPRSAGHAQPASWATCSAANWASTASSSATPSRWARSRPATGSTGPR